MYLLPKSLCKDFYKGIENVEKEQIKKKNKEKVREKLYGNDPLGD